MKPDRISTTQLARICGVSQGTVDRALNNRPGISAATKQHILTVAEEYGYRRNNHAAAIAGGASMLIGIVVFDLYNQYFADLLMSIEEYCRGKGYSTVVMFTGKDRKTEKECIESLYRMYADGIVLCPVNHGEEFENYLTTLKLPVVTVGNRLGRFPYVGIDNAAAVASALDEIVRRGYRRVVYVAPRLDRTANAYGATARLRAFREQAERCGIAHETVEATDAAEREYPAGTALLCSSDIFALRLFGKAKKNRCGIIGFDNIRTIDELGVPLDSVAYDVRQAGAAAIDRLVSGETADAVIEHRIVTRGSL